jgi:lipopolysaccharide assembly protein A
MPTYPESSTTNAFSGGTLMRYAYIALTILVTTLIFVFSFENLASVTVSFFSIRITMPLSLLILLVYVLGMFTGGFVVSLLRVLIQGASKRSKRI